LEEVESIFEPSSVDFVLAWEILQALGFGVWRLEHHKVICVLEPKLGVLHPSMCGPKPWSILDMRWMEMIEDGKENPTL